MNEVKGLTLNSREVAKMLPKSHKHLLRDIAIYSEYLGESKIGLSSFWVESTYTTSQNKVMKCYQITKKGCEFLAHKMTGKKGALFTAAYINRFHEMERQLQFANGEVTSTHKMKFTTYRGQKYMSLIDFCSMTGVYRHKIYGIIHKGMVEVTTLTSGNLMQYKIENKMESMLFNSVTLFSIETVFELGRRLSLYTQNFVNEVYQYFEDTALPTVQKVYELSKPIKQKVTSIKKKIYAVEAVTDNLTRIKRDDLGYRGYMKVLKEMSMDIASDYQDIERAIFLEK